MVELFVKKLDDEAKVPYYSNEGDAGVDLATIERGVLEPGEHRLFKTGLSLSFPSTHVFLIKDRSGNAYRHGLTVLAGVIDSGYRGDVGVILLNAGSEPYEVEKGDRIAQGLLMPVETADVVEVESHEESSRGQDGFGSTGK